VGASIAPADAARRAQLPPQGAPLGRARRRPRAPRTQCVMITDPELAKEVLHSPHLDKLRFIYQFLDPFLGGVSLLTGRTDAHWKAVRKGVAPSFSAGNMRCAPVARPP